MAKRDTKASLTEEGFVQRGYQKLPEGEVLEARFFAVHLYVFHSLSTRDHVFLRHEGQVAGTSFPMVLGTVPAEIFKELFGTEVGPDGSAFVPATRSGSLYAGVCYGPTSRHQSSNGWANNLDDWIETYRAFEAAEEELRQIESTVHSLAVTAMASLLDRLGIDGQPKSVRREVYGKLEDGRFIRDCCIVVSGDLNLAPSLPRVEIEEAFAKACATAGEVNARAARFLHLGIEEEDNLKSFLYFFLAIEVATHAVFSSIDHAQQLQRIFRPEDRVQQSALEWLRHQQEQSWKSLRDRFVWCAIAVWERITDDDIRLFMRLKKYRDDIAHGNRSEPPAGVVAEVRGLAIKILRVA